LSFDQHEIWVIRKMKSVWWGLRIQMTPILLQREERNELSYPFYQLIVYLQIYQLNLLLTHIWTVDILVTGWIQENCITFEASDKVFGCISWSTRVFGNATLSFICFIDFAFSLSIIASVWLTSRPNLNVEQNKRFIWCHILKFQVNHL
jgi:hypothetical protein